MKVIDGKYSEVEKREMTIDEIRALPNMLGAIASAVVAQTGEYKCTIGGVKTWIVLTGNK